MKSASKRVPSILLAGLLLSGAVASGQDRDAYGAPAGYDDPRYDDPRYDSDDIRQTVARISDIDGRVSYARGDDPDDWQPADRNVPVTIGDRLYTDARSRVELQISGGDFVRLGSGADLGVLNLTEDTRQFALKSGVGSFRVRSLDDWQVFEVDTPNAAVTFEVPGDYRIDVDQRGGTRVAVRAGRAQVAAGGGEIPIRAGDAMVIEGYDDPRYDFVALGGPDSWDRWVLDREARISRARSYEYVHADIAGVDDLDNYGRWENLPSYGWAWSPTRVAVGWAPYRVGRWIWQDPWGWTWLSSEPWGWAPYHYGRWVNYRSRWCWVPVARRVSYVPYYPALVAFTAGGPGWSASFAVTSGGYVGWFPLAPREPFSPWWGRPRASVNVTNITYVNQTYVTVVNQNTFVSGGVVTSARVRDAAVVRQVAAASVLRGPLPVMPTQGAFRVAARSASAPRPSAAIVARPVVSRIAPPPAPPRFDQKLAVIRENRGAPVTPDESARLAILDRGRARAVTEVKPVTAQPGRVNLAPKSSAGQATQRAPQPVAVQSAPVRGRPVATSERPVAQAPVSAPAEARRGRPTSREAAPPPSSRQPAGNDPSDRSAPEARKDPNADRQPPARVERPAPNAPQTREVTSRESESESKENDRNRARPSVTSPSGPPPDRPAPAAATPRSTRSEKARESSQESPSASSNERPDSPKQPANAREAQPDRSREAATEPARPSASSSEPAEADKQPSNARQAPDRSKEQARPQPTPSVERRGQPERPTPADGNGKEKKKNSGKKEPTKKPTPDRE